MKSSPKKPKPTEQELALERSQLEAISNANVKTNSTLKRLMSGSQGSRLFRGSPILRDAPSDTAAAAPEAPRVMPDLGTLTGTQRQEALKNDPLLRTRFRSAFELVKGGKLAASKFGQKFLSNFDAKYGSNPK